MKIRAQIGMVLNLDKCIGCHTCSVTCKNVWTNRPGTEYIWFNNVESKPGVGYPKSWEDQQKWTGGWELHNGKLRLRRGSKLGLLSGTSPTLNCRRLTTTTSPLRLIIKIFKKPRA